MAPASPVERLEKILRSYRLERWRERGTRHTESVSEMSQRFAAALTLNGDSSPMRMLLVLPMIALAGCLASRMQSQGTDSSSSRFDPAQRLSPTAFEQNATMKDTSVHEDPNLLKVGVSRDKIIAAFGTPNQINNQSGQEEDVYEFNPDGSKFAISRPGCSRAGSRLSCTRPVSITPNSSSLSTT